MPGRTRVLIIDDEYKTLELLGLRLQDDGFDVLKATSGIIGLKMAYESHPDVIILDVHMPGLDGFEVCSRLRAMTDAIILFVTVRSMSEDVVRGLYAGADDYIVKPFNYQELLARLTACLRRRSDARLAPVRLEQGEALLIADPSRRLVFINDGRSVQLTPKEFDLLHYLVKNRGRVLSAEAILANVWGSGYDGERDLVKQFIYRLRSKLEADPSKPEYILTIRGSGYTFEEDTHPNLRLAAKQQIPAPVDEISSTSTQISLPNSESDSQVDLAEGPPWRTTILELLRGDKKHRTWAGLQKRTWVVLFFSVFLLGLFALINFANSAGEVLPGDMLYPLKTGLEDVRQALTFDEVGDILLHLHYAENRLKEIEALMAMERSADLPAAVAGFEAQVTQLAQMLRRATFEQHPYAGVMGALMEKDMAKHTTALSDLAGTAPETVKPVLGYALVTLGKESASIKDLLYQGVAQEDDEVPFTGESDDSNEEKPTQAAKKVQDDSAMEQVLIEDTSEPTATPTTVSSGGKDISTPINEEPRDAPPTRVQVQPTCTPILAVGSPPTPTSAPVPTETPSR
jgi:two-component system response regulator VicR